MFDLPRSAAFACIAVTLLGTGLGLCAQRAETRAYNNPDMPALNQAAARFCGAMSSSASALTMRLQGQPYTSDDRNRSYTYWCDGRMFVWEIAYPNVLRGCRVPE